MEQPIRWLRLISLGTPLESASDLGRRLPTNVITAALKTSDCFLSQDCKFLPKFISLNIAVIKHDTRPPVKNCATIVFWPVARIVPDQQQLMPRNGSKKTNGTRTMTRRRAPESAVQNGDNRGLVTK